MEPAITIYTMWLRIIIGGRFTLAVISKGSVSKPPEPVWPNPIPGSILTRTPTELIEETRFG